LAVQVTLAEARGATTSSAADAAARLRNLVPDLLASADAREGIASLIERRPPVFIGA
jgi:enoyl-CoA hydratase